MFTEAVKGPNEVLELSRAAPSKSTFSSDGNIQMSALPKLVVANFTG